MLDTSRHGILVVVCDTVVWLSLVNGGKFGGGEKGIGDTEGNTLRNLTRAA